MKLDSPIRTRSLLLRGLSARDASGRYRTWMRDPEIQKYLESRFVVHTVASLRRYIEDCNAASDLLLLGICLANGRHIGNIKLGPVNTLHQIAAVGLLIGERDCWGKGYASEAIVGVTRHAFTSMAIEKLYAGCYASNVGSAQAFVKAGWIIEGRSRAHWQLGSQREDNILLGIDRATWSAADR